MRAEARLVFDGALEARGPGAKWAQTYTSVGHTDYLSAPGRLSLSASGEVKSRKATPLVVVLEHSADGIHFEPKHDVPLVAGLLQTGQVLAGGEPLYGPSKVERPSLRFSRLRIEAGDRRTPFWLRLALRAEKRGEARVRGSADVPSELRGTALFGLRFETLAEAHEVVRASLSSSGRARVEQVFPQLRRETQNDLLRVAVGLSSLDGEQKQLVAGAVLALLHAVSKPGKPPEDV